MKILLDHCLDWRLGRALAGHDVKSVRDMGWEKLTDAELLKAAGKEFDVLVTVDQNMKDQQNLGTLPIAVAVLIAPTNRLKDCLPLAGALEEALKTLGRGMLVEVRNR